MPLANDSVINLLRLIKGLGSRLNKYCDANADCKSLIKKSKYSGYIKTIKYILITFQKMDSPDKPNSNTVDQIVNEIISELPLDDKVRAANLDENGFAALQQELGKYIRHFIDSQTEVVNEELMADCIDQSGNGTLNEFEAASLILKEIWNRLRKTHRLRVVK